MDDRSTPATPADAAIPSGAGYDPPRVEQVVTAEDLSRELQYAGSPISER